MIVLIKKNWRGKIELTAEQLQQYLDEAKKEGAMEERVKNFEERIKNAEKISCDTIASLYETK